MARSRSNHSPVLETVILIDIRAATALETKVDFAARMSHKRELLAVYRMDAKRPKTSLLLGWEKRRDYISVIM